MACYICGYPSVLKCKRCGKSVCGTHYNYDTGLCVKCFDEQFKAIPDAIETKPAIAPVVKPVQPKAKKVRR